MVGWARADVYAASLPTVDLERLYDKFGVRVRIYPARGEYIEIFILMSPIDPLAPSTQNQTNLSHRLLLLTNAGYESVKIVIKVVVRLPQEDD